MKKDDAMTLRYEAMYGRTEGKKRADKDRKNTRMMYILLAVAFVLAGGTSVWSSLQGGKNMTVSDDGRLIAVERPGKGEGQRTVDVKVSAEKDGMIITREKQLLIDESGGGEETKEEDIMKGESQPDKINRKVDGAVRSLNEDTSSKNVYLPSKLDDGTKLSWQYEKKNNMPMLLLVFAAAFFAVYMGRYSSLKKEERMARESVLRDLPEFINKTVLLLRGGIVISEALMRVIHDRRSMAYESYFYGQLVQIEDRVKKTNSSIHEELTAFARRSGVRELMRTANIISDNIGKGSDLTSKLTRESSMLWFARKKHAEEKGHLAETKLTVPLVILIGVLVTITVAPALMEI